MKEIIKIILMSIIMVPFFNGCNGEKKTHFSYVQPEVNNGKTKAVIEIGSSGFNLFVIEVDKDKNWKLKKAEWGKKSEIYDANATIDKIQQGVKDYINHISECEKDNIYFVISSGARKATITNKIIDILKSNYKNIKLVSAEEEAQYGFLVAVPKEYRKDSFLVDIGSGNTKIAWLKKGKIKTLEGYGSKAYKLNKSVDEVYKNIKGLAEDIPKDVTKRCFFIGGVAYKLAKDIRKNKNENYTVLLPYNKYENFKKEKMKYGLKIYQAISEVTGTKIFIFPWNGNFAIGYLISLPY
jgi:hypothetical protein